MHRKLIWFLAGAVYMSLGLMFHSGVKEGYFAYFILPTLFCSLGLVSISPGTLRPLLWAACSTAFFWISAELFWSYMDRPWFNPEPTYEGQYGWFSFENELPSLAFPLVGTAGVFLGYVIKLIRGKLAKAAK
ncbi:MAG TPA: hypothetical protein VHS59_04580 [Bacillota bacterium]|nr:hypothetical protein [Bacillota bacterium]